MKTIMLYRGINGFWSADDGSATYETAYHSTADAMVVLSGVRAIVRSLDPGTEVIIKSGHEAQPEVM